MKNILKAVKGKPLRTFKGAVMRRAIDCQGKKTETHRNVCKYLKT